MLAVADEQVDTAQAVLRRGPAHGLGPFGWDRPLPGHVIVYRVVVGRIGAWQVVFPEHAAALDIDGRQFRYNLDRADHDSDPWNATYLYAGPVVTPPAPAPQR